MADSLPIECRDYLHGPPNGKREEVDCPRLYESYDLVIDAIRWMPRRNFQTLLNLMFLHHLISSLSSPQAYPAISLAQTNPKIQRVFEIDDDPISVS